VAVFAVSAGLVSVTGTVVFSGSVFAVTGSLTGCFTCSGFTGQENVPVTLVDQLYRQLEHFVVCIGNKGCHR